MSAPMSDPADPCVLLSLTETVAATGLGAEVLRAWERRYGFPQPLRDARGRRFYPRDQVERLAVLRQRVDAGERPGRIVGLSDSATALPLHGGAIGLAADVEHALGLAAADRIEDLAGWLARLLALQGARRFVIDTAAPLTTAIGNAWHDGRLTVAQEHAYAQVTHAQLAAIARSMGTSAPPRVLLTTMPGEGHGLGLAMVEALLAIEGCACVPLGLQTPLDDILGAARAHRVDVVALSFSAFFGARRAVRDLATLRTALDPRVALWAGGACAGLRGVLPPGITRFTDLAAIAPAVQALRDAAQG